VFAHEEDAETAGGDGDQVGEGSELGSFDEAEKPEIEKIGDGRREQSHEEETGPGLPRKSEPSGERAERDDLPEGERKNHGGGQEQAPESAGKRIVLPCYAFAEYDPHGETKGTEKRDDVAEKRGGTMGHAGAGGEKDDAGKRDQHAGGFAPGGLFQTEEDSEDQSVDGAEANDDGRVGDVGAAESNSEADLIDDEAEETEVSEDPVVAPSSCGGGAGRDRGGGRRQMG